MADRMKTRSEEKVPRIPLAGKLASKSEREKLEYDLRENTMRKEPINSYIERGEARAKKMRPKKLGTIYSIFGISRLAAKVRKRQRKATQLITQRHGRR